MADIEYKRKFAHDDWIDNEDLVQADGEKGFNVRFHALEKELDNIGTVVGKIAAEIQKQVHLTFVVGISKQLNPGQASPPQQFDSFPGGPIKLYHVVIDARRETKGASISHQISYATDPSGTPTNAFISFKNEGQGPDPVAFTANIFSLV